MARVVERKEPWGAKAGAVEEEEEEDGKRRGACLFRSLFSVLRRGEVSDSEQQEEEVEKGKVDVVEDRLEGWREGQEEGCSSSGDR